MGAGLLPFPTTSGSTVLRSSHPCLVFFPATPSASVLDIVIDIVGSAKWEPAEIPCKVTTDGHLPYASVLGSYLLAIAIAIDVVGHIDVGLGGDARRPQQLKLRVR